MKIGIVTFWWTEDNYGQVLQCYALQCLLRKMGHDPFLIKTYPDEYKVDRNKRYYINTFLSILNPKKIFIYIKRKLQKRKKGSKQFFVDRKFDEFRDRYISSTPNVYHYSDLMQNPPIADVYITGSDQVWCHPSPIYYLNWGDKKVKRVSYAASFGFTKASLSYINTVKPWLKMFDIVSVREESGIEICGKAGRKNAICVPDPTLMLEKLDYVNLLVENRNNEENILLLYLLGNEIDFEVQDIYDFAARYSLKVKFVASQGRFDSYQKEYPTIENWLSLINDAKYIVTNSFHGTVFSIIFEKKFLVIPLSGKDSRMNTRIDTLLNKYDLQERKFIDDLDVLLNDIDFSGVKKKIAKERENAISFLFKF